MKLVGEFDRFRAIAGLADHGDFGLVFEDAAESATHEIMIVNQ
jgi:hypothetical protein